MPAFREFEKRVLHLLADDELDRQTLESVCELDLPTRYDYTGAGYFLTVSHPRLPIARRVCSSPLVVGTYADIQCGFVVFFGEGELTLECHAFFPEGVPEDFRELDVEISVPDETA